jgi:hypothetical protein
MGGAYTISALAGETVMIEGVTLTNHTRVTALPPTGFTVKGSFDCVMSRDAFMVTGTVTNQTGGAGLVGATVSYKINGGATQTTNTAAGGAYTISAFAGETVTIEGVTLMNYIRASTLPASNFTDTGTYNCVMSRDTFSVTGTVTNQTGGIGLDGVTVSYKINSGGTQTVLTTMGGAYTISALAGETVMIEGVTLTNHTRVTALPVLGFTIQGTYNCQMSTTFTVTGQVILDGKGLAGVKITYTIDAGPQTTVTDVNGMYSINAPVGKTITIMEAELGGYTTMGSIPWSYATNSTANFIAAEITSNSDLDMTAIMIVVVAIIGGLVGAAYFFIFRKR